MKSTYCEVNGVPTPIFKQPKTDSGKNSHKGLLQVSRNMMTQEYMVLQNVTREEEQSDDNCLVEIFRDGKMLKETTLKEIRERIDANAAKIV
jgi:nicotinamide phosphoribosyltransferase